MWSADTLWWDQPTDKSSINGLINHPMINKSPFFGACVLQSHLDVNVDAYSYITKTKQVRVAQSMSALAIRFKVLQLNVMSLFTVLSVNPLNILYI